MGVRLPPSVRQLDVGISGGALEGTRAGYRRSGRTGSASTERRPFPTSTFGADRPRLERDLRGPTRDALEGVESSASDADHADPEPHRRAGRRARDRRRRSVCGAWRRPASSTETSPTTSSTRPPTWEARSWIRSETDPPAVRIADEATWVHPPLGKWIIALLGIGPIGQRSIGWRLPSAVFGIAGVALLYLLALHLWRSVWWAGFSALLLALDGLHIVQSRMAMLDIFLTTFITAAVLFLVLDRERMESATVSRPMAPDRSTLRLTVPSVGGRLPRMCRRHEVVGRVRAPVRRRALRDLGVHGRSPRWSLRDRDDRDAGGILRARSRSPSTC